MRNYVVLFTAREIAVATNGRLVGDDAAVDGASIDSRDLAPGSLFIPIVAERDGHDFISAALDAGAAAYLTEREPAAVTSSTAPAIVVDDSQAALTALGVAARDRHSGHVVAITGSVGKTSVKDLAAAAISARFKCHASERSFNNELGVPLTLLNAAGDTEVLIVEMGARGQGHIAHLCSVARPTVGLVTWVGAVHTSEFGSIEAVAAAKGELIESLDATGRAILNAECAPVLAMTGLAAGQVMTYGLAPAASAETTDVFGHEVELDDALRPRFVARVEGKDQRVELKVHGRHQASNALGAIAAAVAVGVDASDAVRGLSAASLSRWRMELLRTPTGATVINDAYNANAVSTASALRSLAVLPAQRRIAVLGVMAELGDRHDDDHQAMGALCDELGIELIAFQEDAYGKPPVGSIEAAIEALGRLGEHDAVLVKGSRVAELERLAEKLVADD